jgi:E3 ubiquitin-protein ligase FANCL
LSSVFHYFTHIITKFQSFFNEMDDIDLNLWVLEPSLPSRRSCNERRIALREGLSIHLVFDPEHPRSSPISMRLSGTAKDIQELRNAYQNYVIIATNKNSSCESKNDEEKDGDRRNNNDTSAPLPTITKSITNLDDSRPHQDHHQQQKLEEEDKKKHWTEDLSIRLNLEACFGFSLPSPASTAKEDFVGECGICYSHRLPIGDGGGDENDHHLVNGGTRKKLSLFPSIICSNSSCSRHYHESCLLEWLHSLPNVKVRFDRIHGICPYCCGDISVKFSN